MANRRSLEQAIERAGPVVLLVDDDLGFLEETSARLANHVRAVHVARTPLDALRVLQEVQVDVVVSDLQLAESDGLHLLEAIREQWPTVARILITGFGDRLTGRDAFPAAQAMIRKPCDAASLVALMEALPPRGGGPAAVLAARSATGAPLRWRTTARPAGGWRVAIEGELKEEADLGPLELPGGPLVLELGGIRAINSAGVHELGRLLDRREGWPVTAEGCSPAVVRILNMMPALSRRIEVRSVVAPLECSQCRLQCSILVEIGERPPVIPDVPCPECPGSMALVEPPEEFFAFLKESE